MAMVTEPDKLVQIVGFFIDYRCLGINTAEDCKDYFDFYFSI
jgi:hypothetical protein